MNPKIDRLNKSFKYILFFYIPIFLLVFIYFILLRPYNINLLLVFSIIIFGNLFIGLFTQIANYVAEKYSVTEKSRDFLYLNFTDCFFRSLAGLSEVIFYTISFAVGLETLVAGYLLLKTVSIWQDKDNYNNKKEGLHTAILRTAIVMSLLISFAASFYLKKFINT